MYVVKEDTSIASILISVEWYDREFLKNHDGQVTIGLESSTDEKLELAGRLRRRNMIFRCTVFTVDKSAPGSDPGKMMRNKIVAEINRVIRENRNSPGEPLAHLDVGGYKLVDLTDVKPYVYRAEFQLKGWLIETLSV